MNKNFTKFLAMGAVAVGAWTIGSMYVNANTPEKTIAALQPYHLTDIKVGDYKWVCAKNTPIRRHFEAKDEKGQEVVGEICGGRWLMKDSVEIHKKLKM